MFDPLYSKIHLIFLLLSTKLQSQCLLSESSDAQRWLPGREDTLVDSRRFGSLFTPSDFGAPSRNRASYKGLTGTILCRGTRKHLLGRLAPLKEGARVRVTGDLFDVQGEPVEVTTNTLGRVLEIDEDGDAYINFNGVDSQQYTRRVYVHSSSFNYLELVIQGGASGYDDSYALMKYDGGQDAAVAELGEEGALGVAPADGSVFLTVITVFRNST